LHLQCTLDTFTGHHDGSGEHTRETASVPDLEQAQLQSGKPTREEKRNTHTHTHTHIHIHIYGHVAIREYSCVLTMGEGEGEGEGECV
jgi:hypothetical protein